MKTLFISYNGALEPLIQSQGIPYLRGLSQNGVNCTLLSFEKPQYIGKNFRDKIDSLKIDLSDYGIKWHYLKYHKNLSLLATLYDILRGIALGLYIVITKKIDIIHARATVPAAIGYILARLTRKKFIFDERGLMAEEYIDGGMWKKNSILYKLTLFLEKIFLRRADHVVVLTENIKTILMNTDYIIKHHVEKNINIDVIPCCVDLKRFYRFNKQDLEIKELREKYNFSSKFIFLYIGSVGTWYLLEEMIDFFLEAKSLIKNAHFLILTHIDKKMVKRTWKRRSLPADDITIEEVEFEKMPIFINLADVGMFFIKPVFSKRSSCPTKFAEYLACGLPVLINSGIGDTDKIVEKHNLGVVVKKFAKETYAAKVKELLEMMKEKEKISNRCQKVAESIFSLESGVLKYLDIYRKVNLGN